MIIEHLHELLRERIAVATGMHKGFASVHDDVAEAENVRADDGSLAGHRLEQRDPERRFRRRARIDGAVRVVAWPALEDRADEDDVRIAVGLLVVVLAKWSVANDDEP